MGMMRQMLARTGDTVVTWGDTEVEDATHLSEEEVERQFNAIVRNNHTAVKVTPGVEAEIIKKFDATAEEIVIMPNIMGG